MWGNASTDYMLMERRAEQTDLRSVEASDKEFRLLEQTYQELGSRFSEQL